MITLSLLGKALKDDAVIELLELHDVPVIYDFDRLHENTPDVYWASLRKIGLEFRFNEKQVLDTIFCFIEPCKGFSPASPDQVGKTIFATFALAKDTCERDGLRFKTSANSNLWLKVLGPSHDVHYEFKDGRLSMLTLMLSRA